MTTDQAPDVIVWGTEHCMKCDATKRYLTQRGIPFESRDATTAPPEQMQQWRDACNGTLIAPIVETRTHGMWNDYRPDRLKAYVRDYTDARQSATSAPELASAQALSPTPPPRAARW